MLPIITSQAAIVGMNFFDTAMILKKYKVNYWRCQNCGFIETDTPYWLDESYSDAFVPDLLVAQNTGYLLLFL